MKSNLKLFLTIIFIKFYTIQGLEQETKVVKESKKHDLSNILALHFPDVLSEMIEDYANQWECIEDTIICEMDAITVSSDDKLIIGDKDEILIYDPNTKQCIANFYLPRENWKRPQINALTLINENILAIATKKTDIKLLDLSKLTIVDTIKVSEEKYFCNTASLAISQDKSNLYYSDQKG